MREKIEQLAKAQIRFEEPEVVVSTDHISISVEAGRSAASSFCVSNSFHEYFKGLVYSSDSRVKPDKREFSGKETEITIRVNAEGIEAGTVIDCVITVVTSCGETDIAVKVDVCAPNCISSAGEVNDMFRFANLAKLNFTEAALIFKTQDFAEVVKHYAPSCDVMYRHLALGKDVGNDLEEFLIAIHKKKRITYELAEEKLEFSTTADRRGAISQNGASKQEIVIRRKSWGCTRLLVESDADFIVLSKTTVTDEDFVRDECHLPFSFDFEKLSSGRNYGRITVEGLDTSLACEVTCFGKLPDREAHKRLRSVKTNIAEMIRIFIDYRTNRMSTGSFALEAEKILKALASVKGDSPYIGLMRIYLQIISGKERLARTALTALGPETGWPDGFELAYGITLYLNYLLPKGETRISNEVIEMRRLLERDRSSWQLLLLLLRMDKRYKTNFSARYDALRHQFERGCTSPLVYLDAMDVISNEPIVLKELDRFAIQVLCFGTKHNLISDEVYEQIAYLARREKSFSRLLCDLLAAGYEKCGNPELAFALCSLLVRFRVTDRRYNKWFEIGIRLELQVPELQEYYLKTVDTDSDAMPPQQLLMYYSYDLPEDNGLKAFLLANLIRYRDSVPAVFDAFEPKIRPVACEMLESGYYSRNALYIYDYVFDRPDSDEAELSSLAKLQFIYEVRCKDPRAAAVIVAHKEIDKEQYVELADGRGFVSIFSEDALIFMVDRDGNRHVAWAEFELNRLMDRQDILDACIDNECYTDEILIYCLDRGIYTSKNHEPMGILMRAVKIEGLSVEYRNRCELLLIDYFYEEMNGELLEEHLAEIELGSLSERDRCHVIDLMIIRELYSVAFTAIRYYGFVGVDVKKLLWLCEKLIPELPEDEIESLLPVAEYIFDRRKQSPAVMKYLVKYYNGPSEVMYDMWCIARNSDIDAAEFEERLLAQLLFTDSRMNYVIDVFRIYYQHATSTLIVSAYLSKRAYELLLKGVPLEAELFDIMKRELSYVPSEICTLAMLRYLSQKSDFNESEVLFIEHKLQMFEEKGMLLPFFKDFPERIRIPISMKDKYYVEYASDPKCRVMIHYNMDALHDSRFHMEEMRNVGYGIFVKEFVIFYGEMLQYYISEDREDRCLITESCQVRPEPAMKGDEATGYKSLNLIITAREMNDDKAAIRLLENYAKKDYMVKALFKPIRR